MLNQHTGTLVMLACHGVFDPEQDTFYGEHPEDRPVYEAQLKYAFQHMTGKSIKGSLLVISGGYTQKKRRCSESSSYLEEARFLGLTCSGAAIALEEHALTSIENLLFSIYLFHKTKGVFPELVEVISWEFKRERFEKTLEQISLWPRLQQKPRPQFKFFPRGDLRGRAREQALKAEKEYIEILEKSGIEGYYNNEKIRNIISTRDVFATRAWTKQIYSAYPLPF